MANRRYTSQFLYQFEAMPVKISCNFIVTPSAAAGIASLKGEGVKSVFMNSSSPAGGNPDPEDGIIQIQLKDNYSRLLGFTASVQSPNDGSAQTATTAGRASVITALGSATLAQWRAKGLPVGVTPAVGVCFIATASGTIGGSAAVQRPLPSGITNIELCGIANQAIALSQSNVNGGSIITLQALVPTVATDVVTMARKAPATGSLIYVDLWLSNSSVVVAGQ